MPRVSAKDGICVDVSTAPLSMPMSVTTPTQRKGEAIPSGPSVMALRIAQSRAIEAFDKSIEPT